MDRIQASGACDRGSTPLGGRGAHSLIGRARHSHCRGCRFESEQYHTSTTTFKKNSLIRELYKECFQNNACVVGEL